MSITGVGRSVPVSFEATPPPPEVAAENREVVKAVQAIAATDLFGDQNQLTFRSDPETRRIVVRVVNRETDELVFQIPNEYVLRIAEELRKQSR